MNDQNYTHLKRILKKISQSKGKNIPINQDLHSDLSENDLDYNLIALLGTPDKLLQKKIIQIINQLGKFQLLEDYLVKDHIFRESSIFPSKNEPFYEFLLFHLVDRDYALYQQTLKELKQNFEFYEPKLIFLLIHENDALSINAARILVLNNPSKYPNENVKEILPHLEVQDKEQLFRILQTRLKNKLLPWNLREEAILKLALLKKVECIPILLQFIYDPDKNCRETLASVLSYYNSPEVINGLLKFLLDSEHSVRIIAAESLSKIIPGLYELKTPQNILLSLDPEELLSLIKEPKFDRELTRTWDKLGFDAKIIEALFSEPNDKIIWKVVSEIDSCSNQKRYNSFIILLKSKMPVILNRIQYLHSIETNTLKLKNLEKLTNILQLNNQINMANGYNVLL